MKRFGLWMIIFWAAAVVNASAETLGADASTLPATGLSGTTDTNAASATVHRTVVLPDGTLYEGDLRDGKPNGQGTLMTPLGTHQYGEWHNGNAYKSTGTWALPNGTKEVGSWDYSGGTNG